MKSILLFAAASLFAVPATAADADEGLTVRVDYADLDLTDPADVTELRGRLATVLQSACGLDTAESRYERELASSCVDDGMFKGRRVIERHREQALAAPAD
jgi:UrcA family protein